ncbi:MULTISPECIES: Zn-dependent alcohol dehydrogenase [unclassified Novosphingobium]|uniref:Zn-dependent alcohol dehydrogenase n=1 Tax=unclassified Novosphingobium TaxID=2644732 RepID=UPI00146EF704|nr:MULTISPECIES: Zn-dependent alcohol dehydrogenase [unclassified Novosphingobium]NMN03366.1 S-(hydroxymethyl)glutathione dehydrogenase/alcohol dehydrogenase [Novosphingobium sp. SG919]NMN86644.1 S-(hydroxymethyl)glutathione dehydrogenase/alcohol dehydrogenase [Novosphingobium sp. SG916]
MKAAVIVEQGQPLAIEDLVIDQPGPHEVLIRTVACGLCHSDLHFIDGAYPHALPAVPGHEAAGIVEAVGSHVQRLKKGDAVVTCLSAFCGTCEFCVSGRMALCLGSGTRRSRREPPRLARADGTPVQQMLNLSALAEMMLVHENACVAIRPDMPLDRAALLGCAVTTGAGTVFNACKLTPGESVAVIGCGGVGLAAVNAARIAGAGRIIAADPSPEKRALARQMGATDTIDPTIDGAAGTIVELTRGGVDHAIEAVGRPDSGALAVNVLRRGGTATILGMMPLDHQVGLSAMDLLSGKKLQGALMGMNRFPVDLPRLVDFYMNGLLQLDTMLTMRIGLSQVNEGFAAMRQGDGARAVVLFDGP